MSLETARKTAEFILSSPAKAQVLEFSGGDPLLNFPAIREIVRTAKKLGKEQHKDINFSIIQNGTNWNQEKMDFFIDNKIGVCFSLDGPKELHDFHRKFLGGQGTHDEVTKWIKNFRKAGYKLLHAIPVITKKSLSYWKEIVDEYLSYGFRVVRFKYLGYFGRAAEKWDELGYTPEEFLDAWKKVIEYMFELNKRGVFIAEGIAQVIAGKLFSEVDPGYCELQMPCGAAISQIAYSPDGSVYTCDEGRMFEEFKLGTVDHPLSKILNNNTVKGMVVASSGFFNQCDNCVFRPFCGTCPLEAYHQQGDVMSKLPFDRRCKIHRGMIEYMIGRMSEDPGFREMIVSWVNFRGSVMQRHLYD